MAYDSAVVSFTTKTDKVDLVQAAHMNAVQSELVTIETILGTGVKGTCSDLKTRLAVCFAQDGSLQKGSGMPCSAIEGQMYYRTSDDTLYIYDGSVWDGPPASTGNVLFEWHGCEYYANDGSDDSGFITSTSLTATGADIGNYSWIAVFGTTYQTVLTSKFRKISGVSTVNIWAKIWSEDADGGRSAYCNVIVGSTSGAVSTTTETTPTWCNGTIDVSSLVNGTTYDVSIQLKTESVAGDFAGLISIVLIGS